MEYKHPIDINIVGKTGGRHVCMQVSVKVEEERVHWEHGSGSNVKQVDRLIAWQKGSLVYSILHSPVTPTNGELGVCLSGRTVVLAIM